MLNIDNLVIYLNNLNNLIYMVNIIHLINNKMIYNFDILYLMNIFYNLIHMVGIEYC